MINDLPPQNIEVEEAILGGILLDPFAITQVESELDPFAFYVHVHREIYTAALKLHRAGQPTDLMTVTIWLQDRNMLEKVGGTAKLAQLLNRTVSAANIDRYVELVMDKYLRRQLIASSNEIASLGYDTSIELDDVLNQSEQKLFKLSNQRISTQTEHNSAIVAAAFNELEENSPIYPTGYYDLDNLMVGFEPGTLTILAGRPSMGKSFIGMNLATQMMLEHDLPVLFCSLEMTKKQLEYRLWSLISALKCYEHHNLKPIECDRIRRHRSSQQPLEYSEMVSIAKIVGIASELPLYMNDNRGTTVCEMASAARQIKTKEGKLGLIVVDYLQMMASDSGGNRSYELGDVARGLYKMAGDLNVPVLALSQISRGVEGRQNKRPMMSDLSQSSILEMVADNIILIYRDEYYNPDTLDEDVLELILAKARHGSTGTVKVLFDKSYGMIRNMA
ncbi:MAG: replicative DNA helicase [Xenococcaceae cyanobacterium]